MSELAVAAQSGSSPVTTMLRRTVAVVDMVGYSDVARMLEQNISALSVADLNRQIQSFITRSLDRLPNQQAFCVVSRPGDGIILLFENANDAHDFAYHVHLFAAEHNNERSEATAERWFRIGIATGDVSTTACANRLPEYAGITIANAVRLESKAKSGEILIDNNSFELLSAEIKPLYAPEETVAGKRDEHFQAHRLLAQTRNSHINYDRKHHVTRRVVLVSGAAAVTTLAFATWRELTPLESWVHPLPSKRFVAVFGWPRMADPNLKPMLLGVIDVILRELTRAEASDHDLFLTTQASAADMTTSSQIAEASRALGTNLILATSIAKSSRSTKISFELLDAVSNHTLRSHTLDIKPSGQQILYEQAVRTAASMLNIRQYRPDESHFKTGTSSAEARSLLEEAEALFKKPNDTGLSPAIQKYQQALSVDPHYADAYAKLALAYNRLYVLSLDPAVLTLARANCKSALNIDPQSVEAHLAFASILIRTGDNDGALREFATALSIDPSNPRTLIDQARFYARLNRWELAEDTFARVLQLRPNLWLAHIELGVVFSSQGKYEKALSEYRYASIVLPTGALSFSNMGAILFSQGKVNEAAKEFMRSYELKPSAEAASNLAETFRVQGKYEDAIKFALKSTQISSSDPLNWLELGDCYSMASDKANLAQDSYKKAATTQHDQLQTEPKNGPGWMIYALATIKSGESQSALAFIKKAESLAAGDIDSQLFKARCLELLGMRNEALLTISSCFQRGVLPFAIQLMPDMSRLEKDMRYVQLVNSSKQRMVN